MKSRSLSGDSKVRPTHAALNGVTLPPSSPFWDSFMPPNGWNCRCTAVQVRRGKYPHIDVAEALALGEEATADDKRGMLRFNPGKLGKTFPDYNPYTISRCRDCDVAKGKSTFAKDDVPESEQCAACRGIHNECNKKRHNALSSKKKEIIDAATKIGIDSDNLETGRLSQTRKAFKRAIGHAQSIEEAEMYQGVTEHIDELIKIGKSPLGEGKDLTNPAHLANIEKKKARGVVAYYAYELNLDGVIWNVKTEIHKSNTEAIYYVRKKK